MSLQKEDKISQIMNDPKKVQDAIQSAINEALLKHKQAGNPVCESQNGKVVWIKPENILIKKTPS